MILTKSPSPVRAIAREKRRTSSGRIRRGSAKVRQPEEETILPDPVPVSYASFYMPKQAPAEMLRRFRREQPFLIAPDTFIPNSSFRTVFKRKEVKVPEVKEFELRLDILKNLPINREPSDLCDDEPMAPSNSAKVSKSANNRKPKVPHPKSDPVAEDITYNKYWTKDTMPQLFKRMQSEAWWKQTKDDKPNLLSMLLYLTEIIRRKRPDSYESACFYLVEIFRNFGMEPLFLNQNLDILARHLSTDAQDPFNICTIRTIAQFMIEQKDLIVQLLEYALNFQLTDPLRQEVLNAVKFITDIGSSEDIQLALDNLSVVHDASENNFSLKAIIQTIASMPKVVTTEVVDNTEEDSEVHPLLRKIAKERWFPREKLPITLDYVLETIIAKLPQGTKTLVKTLTTYLVQLSYIVGYSQGQFDRVADALISLLSHSEADYRLIAATNLADLKRETKAIDLALLNSFINDPRVLVRTECCDALKILTGITSDTLLKDCAEDIIFLQTLPAENFKLRKYLQRKNRLPTPPLPIEEQPSTVAEEQSTSMEHTKSTKANSTPVLPSHPSFSKTAEQRTSLPVEPISDQLKVITMESSVTPSVPPSNSISPEFDSNRQPMSVCITQRPPSISTIATNTVNSYGFRNYIADQNEEKDSRDNFDSPSQTTIISDVIQTILEEHRQAAGFYRMIPPNRRLLVPHKITLDHIFGDQSHMVISARTTWLPRTTRDAFQSQFCSTHSMSFFDFNYNQRQLHEVEAVQLLSSLVVRAIQIHRNHDRFVPGSCAAGFTDILNIAPMPLVSPMNADAPSKLPPILLPRSRLRQYPHLQAKAIREGIDVQKAQNMQGALSNLLRTNVQSSITYSSTSHVPFSRDDHVTHGWLLLHLLKSEGVVYSKSYLQRIMHSYPKFLPLLHTRVPQYLISIIWNDPMMKHIASMFKSRQNDVLGDRPAVNVSQVKPSVGTTDDEQLTNSFHYLALAQRDDQKKRFLPSIRPAKTHFPPSIFKIGPGKLEVNSCSSSNRSVPTESKARFRTGRCHMQSLMSSSDSMSNQQDLVKSRSRSMRKTDYHINPFLPLIARAPMHD